MNENALLWYHVPKTGGTTIRRALELRWLSGVGFQYLRNPENPRTKTLTADQFRELPAPIRARVVVLAGHDVFVDMKALLPGKKVAEMTILREPGSWAQSRYMYDLVVRNETKWGEFENFATSHANSQAKFLARRLGVPLDADALLERLEAFWYVAETETLDSSLPDLLSSLGCPVRLPPRQNVMSPDRLAKRSDVSAPSSADLDRFRERSPIDLVLHQYAVQKSEATEVSPLLDDEWTTKGRDSNDKDPL